jgi:hypothetical protein
MPAKAAVQWFVTAAAARDEPHFSPHRLIGAHNDPGCLIDADQFRVEGCPALHSLTDDCCRPVHQFFHVCLAFFSL